MYFWPTQYSLPGPISVPLSFPAPPVMPSEVDAQSPGKSRGARPPLPPPGLTGANWEMVVAGRTLLTVVSAEVGPAVAAARALLTVLRVLRVAAAS